MNAVKVTVYVTCRNYGRYLVQALDSVFAQSMQSWELIVFDDASSDNTSDIAEEFRARRPETVRVETNTRQMGLRSCANRAIELARGEYVVRLDADDYFDESALLVMSDYLDKHPDVGLVYPNWIYIGEEGEFLGVETRKKVFDEAEVLDLPAHGACTMIRKRVLKVVGGYEEQFSSQDGHELWIKVLHRFKVGNVRTPLFFYRQHDASMSVDEEKLLEARRKIKRRVAAADRGPVRPVSTAIVPVKNTYEDMPNIALEQLAGKPLIDHTLDVVVDSGIFSSVVVSTDDPAVVDHCERRGDVLAFLRDSGFSDIRTKLAEVVFDAVGRAEDEYDAYSDIVVVLSIHAPLRRAKHIQEAIDTLIVYEVDHVFSTYEDRDLHFRHGRHGMEPLNAGTLNMLRFEREALFVSNGAVHALWRECLRRETLFNGRIGHTVMSRDESLQIKKPVDRWLAGALLARRELEERGSDRDN